MVQSTTTCMQKPGQATPNAKDSKDQHPGGHYLAHPRHRQRSLETQFMSISPARSVWEEPPSPCPSPFETLGPRIVTPMFLAADQAGHQLNAVPNVPRPPASRRTSQNHRNFYSIRDSPSLGVRRKPAPVDYKYWEWWHTPNIKP